MSKGSIRVTGRIIGKLCPKHSKVFCVTRKSASKNLQHTFKISFASLNESQNAGRGQLILLTPFWLQGLNVRDLFPASHRTPRLRCRFGAVASKRSGDGQDLAEF